jgi:hypothetical protein
VRDQKEERRAVEKALMFFENIKVILNRMLVEIQMVKTILVRSQTEMRKVLETRGKLILLMKWQRTWLNCAHVLVFCGR